MSDKPFFLSKGGQSFGPYSQSEIESLREAGEYQRYSWFWDPARNQWLPIDPPPALPQTPQQQTQSVAECPKAPPEETEVISAPAPLAVPATTYATVPDEVLHAMRAVGYDHYSILQGRLANVTEAGCDFVVSSTEDSSPAFAIKNKLMLNLLDSRNGRTMTVSGRVARIERKDGQWYYRMHWKRCPEIMKDNAKVSSPSQAAAG